jgi:hypothetical protein
LRLRRHVLRRLDCEDAQDRHHVAHRSAEQRVEGHAERARIEVVERAIDRGLGLRCAMHRAVERNQDRLDAARIVADDERPEQFELGFQRTLGRAHMRRRRGIAEAFVPVFGRDVDNMSLRHRARRQSKAPGRIVLAHRAGCCVQFADDHDVNTRAAPQPPSAAAVRLRALARRGAQTATTCFSMQNELRRRLRFGSSR